MEEPKVFKKSKKGQVAGIANGFYALMFAAVGLGLAVVIATFVADFVSDKQADFTAGTAAYNVTVDGLTAVETLSEGTEDVADVSVITIILTLLFGVLAIFGLGYMRNR